MLIRSSLAAALLVSTCSTSSFAQNLLANPGFEEAITFEDVQYVGSWEGFRSEFGTEVANSFNRPRSGVQHLTLRITDRDNVFAGVFQDVPVTGGTEYVFSGWHMSLSAPFDAGIEMRIEWLDATVAEIERTPSLMVPPPTSYAAVSLSGLAPAGAEFARLVYYVQTFGPEPTNTGTVFVDDMFFGAVPEPTSMGLLALAGLVFARRSVLRGKGSY